MKKNNHFQIIDLIKKLLFLALVFSLSSGCAVTHHKSRYERKKGLMLLENTSQALNKKFKKTRYAKKSHRKHKRGKRMR